MFKWNRLVLLLLGSNRTNAVWQFRHPKHRFRTLWSGFIIAIIIQWFYAALNIKNEMGNFDIPNIDPVWMPFQIMNLTYSVLLYTKRKSQKYSDKDRIVAKYGILFELSEWGGGGPCWEHTESFSFERYLAFLVCIRKVFLCWTIYGSLLVHHSHPAH